jgi:site-specific DNA recombinase
MKDQVAKHNLRCAIYTRVSTDQGLEQDFNSLDAQREASEAYIKSQAHEGWRLIRDHYDDGGFSGGSMDRPALKKLLGDVQARRIDVIVVYKVDRLTRSLADFAKLVETFDAHGVSFVSVTQSFNTTTSMGRLTLNVLLSFAQFEREVTGERIRDKIAASKKKGMWMGGVVPLGYRVEDRALHIVEDHAEIVRSLFRRYLEAVGRIAHKGQVHAGHQAAIVTQDLWNEVRQSLGDHLGAARTKRTRQSSESLLTGKLYDDSGRRMNPTWARKGSKRWRYYVSQATQQGDKSKTASLLRVPAADVEKLVAEAVGKHSSADASPADIRNLIDRVAISRVSIRIHLSEVADGSDGARILTLPWMRPSPYRKREIIQGANDGKDLCPPDARQRAGHRHRSPSRRAPLARRTSLRFPPDVGVAGFAGEEDRAFDPDDPVARFPRAGYRQGRSRRTLAARLWPETSRRPADGLAGSVAHARTPGAGSVAHARTPDASAGVRNDSPLLVCLATRS